MCGIYHQRLPPPLYSLVVLIGTMSRGPPGIESASRKLELPLLHPPYMFPPYRRTSARPNTYYNPVQFDESESPATRFQLLSASSIA